MADTDVPCANIVHKVLNQDNYELWSFRVKTYLLARDLWSVVTNEDPKKEDNEVEFNIWSKKNAEALHAIHICCGDDIFPIVNGLDKAKAAWDKLEAKFKPTILFENTDEISLDNKINAGNAHGDVGESDPLITVENLRREFPNKHVSESEVEYIRRNGHEYGGIRNAMFIYAVAYGYLDVIKTYLADYPHVLKARSSSTGQTALHSAVFEGHELVVKELVYFMSKEDLEVQDIKGNTALAAAACVGNIQIAKYLVEKNGRLVTIKCLQKTLPLLMAFKYEKWDIAQYLYSVTPLEALTHEDNGREGAQLISFSFYSKEFDIALDLIQQCPTLTFAKDYSGNSPLYILATMHSAFLTGTQLALWQNWIYHSIQIQPAASMVGENIEDGQANKRNFIIHSVIGCFQGLSKNLLHLLGINHIRKKKLVHVQTLEMLDFMCKATQDLPVKQILQESIVLEAMRQAVEQGNVVFVRKMCEANPVLLGLKDGKKNSLLQFSIKCRQEKVYCLLLGLIPDDVRKLIASDADKFGNSLLHSAGWLSSTAIAQLNNIQGAALQLQRELQWFKEVESIVPPKIHDMVNQDRMRARELFTKNHKEMVNEGEKQMKDIASSCTVVGALIVTTMFAAAFEVPHETNGDKKFFTTFIIFDSISLFSSTTSIVIFLGILTSRYAEKDFLESLPKKMIIGLSTLFVSIATMTIAFVYAIVILHGTTWIINLVCLLASIPIISFAWMEFPLLFKLLISTFGRRRFRVRLGYPREGKREGKGGWICICKGGWVGKDGDPMA